MIEEELQQLGLTAGEARVYLVLLERGVSTVGPIIKKARISPSKVYDVLDRLGRKGIVSSVVRGKIRQYKASEPDRLGILLQDLRGRFAAEIQSKEGVLKSVIPRLKVRQAAAGEEYAEILQGIQGIRAFFEIMLDELQPGETELVLGYTKQSGELFDAYFVDYNERCRKKGIKTRVIFDYNGWFRKERRGRPHATYRYLPKEVVVSSFIAVFHDKVGIMTVTERQKFCLLIRNMEVAESYRNYFEFMWKQAINPGDSYKR